MPPQKPTPFRFIGLDLHKHYLVAVGVDPQGNPVLGPRRVPLAEMEEWRQRTLSSDDAVALEMTTNALDVHDELLPHVHSVTVVHPPRLKLITGARVMNDKRAATILAEQHAKGSLTGIWVPPREVRELRAVVAQDRKMVRLGTQAKNRLHAVLHRHHLPLPDGEPFAPAKRHWWLNLPLGEIERMRILCDLKTLAFAQQQREHLDACLVRLAAKDDRVLFLIQSMGIGLLTAMTLLAAIGDIARFPSPKRLVGYAGLGASVHDSGKTTRYGRITKEGRRDLRAAVEAAQIAALRSPYWQAQLQRLEPRLGRNRAIVAIARRMLVAIWHILTKHIADHHVPADRLAAKLLRYAQRLGRAHRPQGQTIAAYVRDQLDRLGVGRELTHIGKGRHASTLPPSRLKAEAPEGVPEPPTLSSTQAA